MPIVRINDQLHYYAHVPKCAGTSVEIYLTGRFGPLAFENRRFLNDPEVQRWTKSSPQHAPLDAFHKLIPKTWIASSFAVVRHPVKRLVSAFGFQADVEQLVPNDWTINEFFTDWLSRCESEPYLYDGHLLPQSALVPLDAAVFPMESGLQSLVAHLDHLAGNQEGSREIPATNIKKDKGGVDPSRLRISPETDLQIRRYYAEDFTRFGYPPSPSEADASAPAPPKHGILRRLANQLRSR